MGGRYLRPRWSKVPPSELRRGTARFVTIHRSTLQPRDDDASLPDTSGGPGPRKSARQSGGRRLTSRRPIAVALATSAFYAGIFVTSAHAEMHYVRVTLVTGQQITITVEIPPGTPVDQLQIPGLPAPVSSIVDLGSTESTPSPTATAPPVVAVTVTPTPTATPTAPPTPGSK